MGRWVDPRRRRIRYGLIVDALGMEFRVVKLRRDPQCPLCGDNPTVTELIDYEGFCGAPFPGEHVVGAQS